MKNLLVWLIITVIFNGNYFLADAFKSERMKPDETQLEALLASGQQKCSGRRCVQSDQCCPSSVCVDVDGIAGTCLPIYGVSEGESCDSDEDCEEGLSCAHNVNLIVNPSVLHQQRQRSCQSLGREMMKKLYNNECSTSSECDSSRGLCCQLIKRHRMAPRKLCYYFSDPQSCIGPVDVTYAKLIHHSHSPTNAFFKARIG